MWQVISTVSKSSMTSCRSCTKYAVRMENVLEILVIIQVVTRTNQNAVGHHVCNNPFTTLY